MGSLMFPSYFVVKSENLVSHSKPSLEDMEKKYSRNVAGTVKASHEQRKPCKNISTSIIVYSLV